MTTRKEAALKTKKNLIMSAQKIISQKGIDSTSIEDITNDANVAKGTFYTYFKSKEDIIKELIFKTKDYDEDFFNKNLKEKILLFNKNLQNRIISSGIEVCRSWIANNLRASENSIISNDIKVIRLILQSSVINKELNDEINLDEFANYIVNLNYGQMLNWCMTDGVYNPLEKINETTEIILNSLKNYIEEER